MSGAVITQTNVSEVNVNPYIKGMWLSLNLAHSHKRFSKRLTCKESKLLEKCFGYFYFSCIAIFVQQNHSRTKIPSDCVIGDALSSHNPGYPKKTGYWWGLAEPMFLPYLSFLWRQIRTLVQTHTWWQGLLCSPEESSELKAYQTQCHEIWKGISGMKIYSLKGTQRLDME